MTPIWFVYHVPKTGGQSIRDHLVTQLTHEADYLHLGKWDREKPLTIDDVAALSEVERAKLRAISGHPVTRPMARFFPGRALREVVILREPAARLVSLYNFNMTMWARRGEPVIGFEEFLDGLPTDQMTAKLTGCFGFERLRFRLDDLLYELSKLWFVGRTENLDALLPLLFAEMGVATKPTGRSNVTGVHIDRRLELTPDLAAELQARNPTDVKLYAAMERLERACVTRLREGGS
ncbi:MAG: hypothetical protein DHS20C19_08960 [Acidimicrobiales bacterium]|nr:MAG: hypothetical protein DHS20C19_08960 [Acidimicrobiales bacterium]